MDQHVLSEIDELVREGVYANRSRAFEAAIKDRVERLHRSRLARECAKLNPGDEQEMADEAYVGESDWPEY